MRILLLALAVPLSLGAAAAQALEPFKIYDRFTDRTIDAARWGDNERVRVVKGGQLQLMQRTWGLGNSDEGLTFGLWNSSIAMPLNVTEIKAQITVTALEAPACAGNPAIADARARIVGSFFNTGVPTPGSQLNDVVAQVRVHRASDSTDPPGLLRVDAFVGICRLDDCSGTRPIGEVVDLGTVALGTPTTVQLYWEQPTKTFYFAREGGLSGTVGYAESDVNEPSLPFRQLSTRVNVPNCQSAAQVNAMIDAVFDNVSVNRSAGL